MSSGPGTPGPDATNVRDLSDEQFRARLANLQAAASTPSVAATPRRSTPAGQNITWQPTYKPDPTKQRIRGRPSTKQQVAPMPTQHQQAIPPTHAITSYQLPFSKGVIPTTKQAHSTTYAPRLKAGSTVLVQPITQPTSLSVNPRGVSRRAGMINYAEPGSGDELDAAADSDDSEFATGSGIKQPAASRSQFRPWNPPGVNTPSSAASPVPSGPPGVAQAAQEAETNPLSAQLSRNMIPRAPQPIKFEHQYISPESMGEHALRPTNLIPIRVELETDNHRIRDCFLWNCNEDLIAPQVFAKSFCADLELPQQYSTQVSAAIQSQIEEHEGIASLDLTDESGDRMSGYEEEECRVLLAIDVQIANYHLVDTIEWDLMSTLSPEVFAEGLCADLGLPGESVPIIAHAVYEEILRHKRDAVEWGAIGGDKEERGLTPVPAAPTPGAATLTQAQPSPGRSATPADLSAAAADRERERRERSGMGLSKDKAGLGLSAAGFGGRSWRDPVGRGSKTLRGIWRDWSDAEEWSTRLEELSPEEVERREIERERASRRLRRETSKFQTSTQTRRRR